MHAHLGFGSQAEKLSLPTLEFDTCHGEGRPLLHQVLEDAKDKPGHDCPFVGFVEARTLVQQGVTKTLRSAHAALGAGRFLQGVAIVARAQVALMTPALPGLLSTWLKSGVSQGLPKSNSSGLSRLPQLSSTEHALVIASRQAMAAALRQVQASRPIQSCSQLAAALSSGGAAVVDATATVAALHWRLGTALPAPSTAESSLSLPLLVGKQHVVVDMQRSVLATEADPSGRIVVRRRQGAGGASHVVLSDVALPRSCPAQKLHVVRNLPVVGSLVAGHGECVASETEETVLTVFTTLMLRSSANLSDPHTQQKLQIQRNVLNALASLRPQVVTVVFTEHPHLVQLAAETGAETVTYGYRRVDFGIPRLKDMYAWVEHHTMAPMYGYMNGDILFGPGLIDTVQLVLGAISRQELSPRAIISGRRYNVQVPFPLPAKHKDNVPLGVSRAVLARTVDELKARAKLFMASAQDYFFITRGAWRLGDIPDFIPGRRMYDNWLIDHAYRDMLDRVDITPCVWAVHQSGTDGDLAGLNTEKAEPNFNRKVAVPYIGGVEKGKTGFINYRLKCPDGPAKGLSLHHLPEHERNGTRGLPWTGLLHEGHVDPISGQTLRCKRSPGEGQHVHPEHGCAYS